MRQRLLSILLSGNNALLLYMHSIICQRPFLTACVTLHKATVQLTSTAGAHAVLAHAAGIHVHCGGGLYACICKNLQCAVIYWHPEVATDTWCSGLADNIDVGLHVCVIW